MAINLKSTAGLSADRVSMLVYGQAGAGKTTLAGTLSNQVIISAEGGLLSLAGHDIPVIEINNMEQLHEAYAWLQNSDESRQFETVAIDSLSEIAEVVLNHEKKATKDPRQAYGAMQEQMQDLIRGFRDLPRFNVYMTAKVEKNTDEMGRVLYSPSMPGAKMPQQLPYFFDEVLALRVEHGDDGQAHRAILCQPDGLRQAKDRSGRLDIWEAPDLGAIINKIKGV